MFLLSNQSVLPLGSFVELVVLTNRGAQDDPKEMIASIDSCRVLMSRSNAPFTWHICKKGIFHRR